jgi:hypothetical protein
VKRACQSCGKLTRHHNPAVKYCSRECRPRKYATETERLDAVREQARRSARKRILTESLEERVARLEQRQAKRRSRPESQLKKERATARAAYERKKASGICVSCADLSVTGLQCMRHWLLGLAHLHKMGACGADILRELWEAQSGRCALTGAALVPGFNASLDHIVPTSRGGESVKDNLQWVTKGVNFEKRNRTNEEFVELCRAVAAYSEGTSANIIALKKVKP